MILSSKSSPIGVLKASRSVRGTTSVGRMVVVLAVLGAVRTGVLACAIAESGSKGEIARASVCLQDRVPVEYLRQMNSYF
jgi:hypothetical protein